MSSDLKVTNIKHESSSSNNLVLGSDGSATATLSSTSVVPASVGSSMVLLKSSTPTGNNTGTDLDNFYSSSYSSYLLYGQGVKITSDGGNVTYQWIKNDGSVETGSYYYSAGKGRRVDGYDYDINTSGTAGYLCVSLGNVGRESVNFSYQITSMQGSTIDPMVQGTHLFRHFNNGLTMMHTGSTFDYNVDFRGIKIYASGANFASPTNFQIYGLKNS